MAQSTLTYLLMYIKQEIPVELLQMAFKPRQFNSTVDGRIISEIIEGPVLLDTNLVGGKRRDIYLQSNWKMDLRPGEQGDTLGSTIESSYYLVPPEGRENANIAAVIGMTPFLSSSLPGSGVNSNNDASYGNTATGMLSEMINTRTFGQSPVPPQITLVGTNIIRLYPDKFADGIPVTVMLENDAEFLNINNSTIMSLRDLALCAVKRYIFTKLRISIDETEVVAGMEIGVVKTMVEEYGEASKSYRDLLMKVKGSMLYDSKSLSRLIYHYL